MKKPLLNLKNKEIGLVELDQSIFGNKIFPDIIHQYIRYQNAKSRQGSHKTKSRSEVNGRSKKPFSQKGTGNARQGSSKPPNFRGGAVAMGPVNRDYSFSLNKKEKKLNIALEELKNLDFTNPDLQNNIENLNSQKNQLEIEKNQLETKYKKLIEEHEILSKK